MNQEFYSVLKKISGILRFNNPLFLSNNNNKNCSKRFIKNIDLRVNNLIVESIMDHPNIVGYISEDIDTLRFTKSNAEFAFLDKHYIFSFDPINNSDSIISNKTIGTIFCLYEFDITKYKLNKIIYSGYCLYGTSTILVETNNNFVFMSQLNSEMEFMIIQSINFNNNKKRYFINSNKALNYKTANIVKNLKIKKYKHIWSDSLLLDFHSLILEGGILIDNKDLSCPDMNLRLLYEIIPLAFIFIKAGGLSYNSLFQNIIWDIENINLRTDIHKTESVIFSFNPLS